MITDWIVIARLARELDERLRGMRAIRAGRLADGRLAIELRGKGEPVVVALDLFFSPPLVTLEPPGPDVAVEPGFPRALDATLRGMTVARIRSRRGDRLIAIDFQTRSRFGVGESAELYVELVPRFGNAVLVKRDVVVAACKEFSPAENALRSVQAGMPYELPPLPAGGIAGREPETLAGPSVLERFAALRAERIAYGARERVERRKSAVLKRLAARERKLRVELEELERKRSRGAGRDALREEGDRIFGTLHELAPEERDAAKERAAELFARYKKLGAAGPHLEKRRSSVERALEAIDALRWECERAADADIEDVEAAVASLEPRRNVTAPAVRRRKRSPLEVRTSGGSRILIGRNPAENAELTFRVARPYDLWFHAQGIPGAHVVLARDDRSLPSDDDVETAAALAAFYSKGGSSAKVPVDYTLRKHVRKRQDAPPGLVWYTHPKTVYARPRSHATVSGLTHPQ